MDYVPVKFAMRRTYTCRNCLAVVVTDDSITNPNIYNVPKDWYEVAIQPGINRTVIAYVCSDRCMEKIVPLLQKERQRIPANGC